MELPKEFIERTRPLLGEEWDAFIASLEQETPTSIRVNSSKFMLSSSFKSVPWCQNGYYLPSRPSFTFDPLLHAGAYYVQEASSMILECAVKQLVAGEIRTLDLCASPGGKSTLLSSLLTENSLLVSNEIIKNRAHILAENMMKWGNSNTLVTNNRPEDYAEIKHFFDLVLVDAPCSGEGMFRKDPKAISEWSVDSVMLCANRQKGILSSIWDALKPGGYLFYSTCTYNREENEEIVEWLCNTYDASVVDLEINKEWGIVVSLVQNRETYHFYPHRTQGEGLYFAVLRKGNAEECDNRIFRINNKVKNKNKKALSIPTEYKSYLEKGDSFTLFENNAYINALGTDLYADYIILEKHLNILLAGINMGQVKGQDFIPHQSLALSNLLNENSFERVEVDWQTAISYLRSEAISLPDNARGYLLLTYRNLPLGFVKNIGNRANNLYPNEWRIRSGNIPKQIVSVID